MKDKIVGGLTSFIDRIMVRDLSQSSTVAGLANLTSGSGQSWYYCRQGDTAATQVGLTAATLGNYTSLSLSAPTGAPVLTLNQTAGGSIPSGNYFGAWTYTANGGQTLISTITGSIFASGAGNKIAFTAPVSSVGAQGFHCALSTSSGTQFTIVSPNNYSGGFGNPLGAQVIATDYNLSNPLTPLISTVTGGGWVAVDNTNMEGLYEISLPNPSIASGYKYVDVMLYGATSMPTISSRIELDQLNYQKSDIKLNPAGLDAVSVELGVNARQALSLIGAACAGVASGLITATPWYQAMNNPSINRIGGICDSSGDRTTVNLNIPI